MLFTLTYVGDVHAFFKVCEQTPIDANITTVESRQ